jgi:two-component system chemotaxis sensor kinase CheA
MSDLNTHAGANAGIDLSQFYQVFFEEAGENLEQMEQLLLALDVACADDEALNAIFRCAHSIKGGAATFGFADVAELTHQMETLLDKLRRHELQPTAPMVDVLLAAGDALRSQLARHQGAGGEALDTHALLAQMRALAAGETPPQAAVAAPPPALPAAAPVQPAAAALRQLELQVGPLDDPAQADSLAELFAEITDLGSIEPLDAGRAADGMRRFKVVTTSSDDDLLDLFSFHVAREQVRLSPFGPGYGFHRGAPGAPEADDAGYGFFDAPSGATEAAASANLAGWPAAPPAKADPARGAAAALESATLRVSVEKVDQLINLVGELVITQAMLAQKTQGIDPALQQQLAAGLADLERNTRDLQESVLSIRMIPMSVVFNRFPRMLRDLAAKLGKKVEMVQVGEATELDKGLVEKITDPLTHLVRNACDHGIETAAERLACGKPEQGTLTLAASHQGGSIVIEVRDDGRGLNRARLLAKAREKGLDAPDSMSDAEVWALIFAPGFSTADAVTDVSGRGVGMDVVKRNISALGGTVEIDSAAGCGMKVSVRLPLTLAIMDGMSIGVGGECYIVPLASVVESFQVEPGRVRTLGGTAHVVEVRDEFMPVVDLEQVFRVPRDAAAASSIMVVVEAEGGRAALRVDELIGQQQVVVKNLESNYRRVDDISGATILGDGRVALILDVASLVRRSRH